MLAWINLTLLIFLNFTQFIKQYIYFLISFLFQSKLSVWISDISIGNLYCPHKGCTWTFFTSFELSDHMKEDCEFARYSENVPCTHCSEVQLKSDELRHHWRTSHKDVCLILYFQYSLPFQIPSQCVFFLHETLWSKR